MKIYTSILFLLNLFPCHSAISQNAGPAFPDTTQNQPLASCISCTGAIWDQTNNVGAVDNIYSEVQLGPSTICYQSQCWRSRYLTCFNFGFNIPLNAQISGIVLTVNSKSDIAGTVLDCTIVLKKNYSPTGTNLASGSDWDTINQIRIYGSPIQLWGLTWTPQEINDINFGTYIKVYNSTLLSPKVYVDAVQITVYFNIGNYVYSQTSSPEGFKTFYDPLNDQFHFTFASDQTVTSGEYLFRIIDMNGKIRFTKKIDAVPTGTISESISSEGFDEGVYFCTLSGKNCFNSSKVLLIK